MYWTRCTILLTMIPLLGGCSRDADNDFHGDGQFNLNVDGRWVSGLIHNGKVDILVITDLPSRGAVQFPSRHVGGSDGVSSAYTSRIDQDGRLVTIYGETDGNVGFLLVNGLKFDWKNGGVLVVNVGPNSEIDVSQHRFESSIMPRERVSEAVDEYIESIISKLGLLPRDRS